MITRGDVLTWFDELEAAGITALPDHACCMSCGLAELDERVPAGAPYVFYHQQDADAFEGQRLTGKLFLAYGLNVVDAPEAAVRAIGRRVVESGRRHFTMEWSGDVQHRIALLPDDDPTEEA